MSRFAVSVLLVGMTDSTIANGVRRSLQGKVLYIILGQVRRIKRMWRAMTCGAQNAIVLVRHALQEGTAKGMKVCSLTGSTVAILTPGQR